MKRLQYSIIGLTLVGLSAASWIAAQDSTNLIGRVPPITSMQGGYQFLTTRVYSESEDTRILEMFIDLRVADVSDGLDSMGLPNVGLIDPDIAPLWVNAENYCHRFVGIAVTARFVPSQEPRVKRTESEFEYWANDWHQNKASGPFLHIMRPGSVMVIDDAPGTDSGTVNSNNVLNWATRGCVGVVTTGGVRDSDEIMTQKMPVYFSKPGRGLRAGRVELESVNRAVVVGGACVMPGDVIVADGDGVVMVPRVYAEKVARYAQRVRYQDRENRRALYEQLALPNDVSVR
jgi:4-hydroxy-4-methyl-2-oxoglutarate aldolase